MENCSKKLMLKSLCENSTKEMWIAVTKVTKKTSEEKSDDNSKSDLENIMKTLKQTDSVETVKPFA